MSSTALSRQAESEELPGGGPIAFCGKGCPSLTGNLNSSLRVGDSVVFRPVGSHYSILRSSNVVVCDDNGDIEWSQWNASDILEGCVTNPKAQEWDNDKQNEGLLYVIGWLASEEAVAAARRLDGEPYAPFEPISPDEFARKIEVLQSLGFLVSSSYTLHTTFEAFSELLRTADWKVMRGHYRDRRKDRRSLPCARLLSGWQAFTELAVFNHWGIETNSEGHYVPGECLRKLEALTVKVLRKLPPETLTRTFDCFNALVTAFPGLANNMPDLMAALTKRWPELAAKVPYPIFSRHPKPAQRKPHRPAHFRNALPAAACMRINSKPAAVVAADSDAKPTLLSSSVESLVSPLHHGGLSSSGTTSPTAELDTSSESESDYSGSEGSESCYSYDTYTTLTTSGALRVRDDLENAEILTVEELYGVLAANRHELYQKWIDLKEIIKYEADQAALVPREERIREPEEYLAMIKNMNLWLLRYELVYGSAVRVYNWPQECTDDTQDIIRDHYGKPCLFEEREDLAEEVRVSSMRELYAEVFDKEFKAPPGIEPYPEEAQSDYEITDDEDAEVEGYESDGSDSITEEIPDDDGAAASEVDGGLDEVVMAIQAHSNAAESADTFNAYADTIDVENAVAAEVPASWWSRAVKVIKESASRAVATVLAGSKVVFGAMTRSVGSMLSL